MMISVATVALALASSPAPSPDDPTAAALVAAHNRERAERKLPPLVAEARLTKAARAHAADMAAHRRMTHDGSDGSAPADRVKRAGYHYQRTGENVADGQRSVEAVMEAWMESPHHRENVLGDFSEVGVARAEDADGYPYRCVDFGLPIPRLDPAKAEEELAERLNHARADATRKPLRLAPALAKAARAAAADLAAKGATQGPPSTPDPVARIKESGYQFTTIAEVVAVGAPTPEEVLKALFASAEQKGRLLDKAYTELGVGYATAGDGRPSWVVFLARPAE